MSTPAPRDLAVATADDFTAGASGAVMMKDWVDRSCMDLARERIAQSFDLFDRVSVSFSGGKDSTVVLNLALDEARRRGRLPLEVFFHDEEAIHEETVLYVERVSKWPELSFRWLCLPATQGNAAAGNEPTWVTFDPTCRDKWVREPPPGAITALPGYPCPGPQHYLSNHFLFPPGECSGKVGILMGIRADESIRRLSSVTRREYLNWISPWALPSDKKGIIPGGRGDYRYISIVKPIYDMTTGDVWAAIRDGGWDYNRAYDLMYKTDLSIVDQRVAPAFHGEGIRNLYLFPILSPRTWERMIGRVPGATTAMRYARSPLYQVGGANFSRLPGETYEAAIRRALSVWSDADREKIRGRLAKDIAKHNKQTNNAPIPEDGESFSGVTWAYLFKIATIGDFKGRKMPKKSYHRIDQVQRPAP